jgi:hypothetical protein
MIRTEDISSVNDGNVHGSDGEEIGSVGQLYLDNHSGQPAWVTVKTGLFGTKASFVPLSEATVDGRDLRVPGHHGDEARDATGVAAGNRDSEHEQRDHHKDEEVRSDRHSDEHHDEREQAGGERRIRRYIVTEETVTRREEIPTDEPRPWASTSSFRYVG